MRLQSVRLQSALLLVMTQNAHALAPPHTHTTRPARCLTRRHLALFGVAADSAAPAEYRVMDRGTWKLAKDCAHCGKVMTMRKKWEKNWADVRYCSDRCRKESTRERRAAKFAE